MSQLDELFAEADRQLRICNACRYCEGLCAVFPALERRTTLSTAEITHLSNLCHDCRACYYACMYAPPHELAINPPEILSTIRINSYDTYLGKLATWFRKRLSGSAFFSLIALLSVALVFLVSGATQGFSGLVDRHPSGSPYAVLPYAALLGVVLVPFILSVIAMGGAAARYWKATHGALSDLFKIKPFSGALKDAGELRYLRGGGPECYYPADNPSAVRRWLHTFTAYGFVLTLIATISAGVMEDLIGWQPPYGIISLPVLTGIIGGAGLVVGSTGLMIMKRRSDQRLAEDRETAADYGFLIGLDFLAITGILALLLRYQGGFGIILAVHLSAIVLCFLIAPYTKFVHFVYRFLALVQDRIEDAD